MKHIVFFLHGIGKQKTGWATEHTTALEVKAKGLIESNNLLPKYEVVYKELFFADLIDRNVKKMLEGGDGLGKINEFLKQGFEERNDETHQPENNSEKMASGIRDFALDVLLYGLNSEFRTLVLNQLTQQIVKTIRDNPGAKYSMVSHSLGTKVSFDCLHLMYKGEFSVDEFEMPAFNSPSFLSYYQLASVSYVIGNVAKNLYTPNSSHVKVQNLTIIPQQFGVITKAYRIINNLYDPVAFIGQSDKIEPGKISNRITLDYIDRVWMHDLTCYLNHPETYLQMTEDFYGLRIDDSVKKELIETYTNNMLEEVSDEIKELITGVKEMMKNGIDESNLTHFILNLIDIIAQIKNK